MKIFEATNMLRIIFALALQTSSFASFHVIKTWLTILIFKDEIYISIFVAEMPLVLPL